MRALTRFVLPFLVLAGGTLPLTAQTATTYDACYVPGVGAVYLINQTGLPTGCLAPSHVLVSWSTGELADGSVTVPKLAFDPATQAELDAFLAALAAAGTINTADNPVDWTQLKNVPAEFADGVDNTGGTPTDLVCDGCVETTDLADAAVTAVQLADAAVDLAHLNFDPATQAELDALVSQLATPGTINDPGNPVDWTQLVNVPADFADGVDNSGGTPSDLVCTDCVETTDLADAAVTEPKLAFDPATQAELDAFVSQLATPGTINDPGNPVDWTQLVNVPADFADGVDNSGGTPSDLVCTDCVETTDLADAAVTEPKLAFDPATQAELDAFVSQLATPGTLNDPGNPVDWTQLTNVPAGFADGVDDGGSGVTDHGGLTGLVDDDHPQYLLAGVRDATNGFAVTGTPNSGTIPVSGAGARLMWYPGKGAFRAGRVNATQWDDANVGYYSTAMGYNSIASGDYSIAVGQTAIASANFATAFGQNTTASGLYSTAMGNLATASGDYSTALGFSTTASGARSMVMNDGGNATGVSSTAMGTGTTASGNRSTAMGMSTTAQAYASLAIGRYNVIAGDATQWLDTDPLFVAGNGTSVAPSNALTLYKNGDLDLAGTLTAAAFVGDGSGLTNLPSGVTDHGALSGLVDDDHPQYLLAGVRDASDGFAVTGTFGGGTIPTTGAGTRLLWYPGKAAFRVGAVSGPNWDAVNVGQYSMAFGRSTTASGESSTAIGFATTAPGTGATALGWGTTASGVQSTAMGNNTTASGLGATAMGNNTSATAVASVALGSFTTAEAYGSLAIGRYNLVSGSQTQWLDTDPLFVAGNGTSPGASSNALTLYKNGDLDLAGTLTAAGFVGDGSGLTSLPVVTDAPDGFALTGTILTGTIPASGPGPRLMWYPRKAAFRAGIVLGGTGTQWDDENVGYYSVAMGQGTTASGSQSTALGGGTIASGNYSTAMGVGSIANGEYSAAIGEGVIADVRSSLVAGRYNAPQDPTQFDDLFVVGNGTNTVSRSNALALDQLGNLTLAGGLAQSSDIRLKENIEPMQRALDDVLDLTPIRYRFREGTGHPTERQIGLSAQEIRAVFPELVSEDSQGYLSVAYTNLTAVLVRAMQEQQAEIEALKAEVAALRAAQTSSAAGR